MSPPLSSMSQYGSRRGARPVLRDDTLHGPALVLVVLVGVRVAISYVERDDAREAADVGSAVVAKGSRGRTGERRRKSTYLVARESEDDEAAVFEFLIQCFETLVLGSESTVDK